MIISKHKITYENGFVQYSNLISTETYINFVKPTIEKISILKNNGKKKEASELKQNLIKQIGQDYFTTGSDIFTAIYNGYITIPYGKPFEYKVIVEELL